MTETNSEGDRAGDAAASLKQKATGMAQAAKERARTEAETRKDSAAGTIHQVASAVDKARDGLSDSPTLSQYVGELSGSIHGLAERLRSRSIDDLANDARSLARRNPTMFVAGSLVIGLLAARFLKATARPADRASDGDAGAGTGIAADAGAAGTQMPAPYGSEPNVLSDPDLPPQGMH